MSQKNKLYIHCYDPKPSWHHIITKPAKWLIRIGTGSKISHMSYSYDYANQKKYIKQSTFEKGFHSVHYKDHFEKRFSKVYSYEIKVPINFGKLHLTTNYHIADKYAPAKAAYSAIDRLPFVGKLWRKMFKIKLNDDKFDFCDKAVLIACFKDQGYLQHIKDNNSLSPEELKKEMAKLCYAPVLSWNKTHFVNNVFNKK